MKKTVCALLCAALAVTLACPAFAAEPAAEVNEAVMLRVDLALAMQPGDDGGHLSAGQPLVQHQTAGAVPPVHAPLPQVRASFVDFRRLLRSKSGAGHGLLHRQSAGIRL